MIGWEKYWQPITVSVGILVVCLSCDFTNVHGEVHESKISCHLFYFLGLWRVLGSGTVWSRNRFQNREPSTCLFLLIRMIGACKQTGSCWNDRMFCCDRCCCCWGNFLLLIGAPARLHESWNSLVSLVHRPIDLRSTIGLVHRPIDLRSTSLLSNLAHIEMLHNNKMRITLTVMGTRHLAPIDISPPWTPRPLGRLAPTN